MDHEMESAMREGQGPEAGSIRKSSTGAEGTDSAEPHSRLDALATSDVMSYAERGGPFANGWECAQRIRAMVS